MTKPTPIQPPALIDAYIAGASPKSKPILRMIRRMINQVVPDATEAYSYGMPAFRRKRIFLYVGYFQKHIGIFPPLRDVDDPELDKSLEPYRGPKGNLKFPLDHPIPYDMIKQVIVALYRQAG